MKEGKKKMDISKRKEEKEVIKSWVFAKGREERMREEAKGIRE